MKLDGDNPVILYAYGGFKISQTPFYSGIMGKLWFAKGGLFVLDRSIRLHGSLRKPAYELVERAAPAAGAACAG